ncbi:HU family DNA-binding protein [Nonomuraea sp. B12E4]|uniref:HU family DNA-binding protein n=1 Tax=Nonomuraea sp. B12E4 TaxID=3153564 RepID=UPI00325DE437
MNKQDLATAVANLSGLSKADAAKAVNTVLDVIQTAVAAGDKVTLTGFGSFEQVYKPARTAKNPATGADVDVAESWAPKFKVGSDFKAIVNEGGRKAATGQAA